MSRLLRKEVDQQLRTWEELFRSGDSHRLAELHVEGGVVVLPDSQMIRGRREIARYWSDVRQLGGRLHLQIDEMEIGRKIGVANGTAVLRGEWPGGKQTGCEVRFAVTWERPGRVLAVVLHSERRSAPPV